MTIIVCGELDYFNWFRIFSPKAPEQLSETFSVRTIIVIYNAISVNITYDLLTSWSRVLLEEPTVALLLRFREFYGTGRFITVFTRAHHWALFCARRI
jgi:hypothetical protein